MSTVRNSIVQSITASVFKCATEPCPQCDNDPVQDVEKPPRKDASKTSPVDVEKQSNRRPISKSLNSKGPPSISNLSIIPLHPSFDKNNNKATIVPLTDVSRNKHAYDDDTNTEHAIKSKIDSKPKSMNKNGRKNTLPKHVEMRLRISDIEEQHGTNDDNLSTAVCSPKHREDSVVPISSPTAGRETNQNDQDQHGDDEVHDHNCFSTFCTKEGRSKFVKQHVSMFPFGSLRTLYPVMLSIIALASSILCKESTSFVTLGRPIYVDAQHEPVTEVGLFFVEYCRTDEYVNIDLQSGASTTTKVNYFDNDDVLDDDKMFFFGERQIINEFPKDVDRSTELLANESVIEKDCRKLKLESSLVSDGLWNTARILVGFTTGIGFLFALALTSTMFWRTANLIAITSGIFISYLCQSFSFLFFDTTICKKYLCYRSTGTTLAIISSACWFFAGLGTLMMYLHERNENHKVEVAEMTRQSRKRRRQREDELISRQWALFDHFFFLRPSSRSEDTESSSDGSEGSRLSM